MAEGWRTDPGTDLLARGRECHVSGPKLGDLVDEVQASVGDRLETYRRSYERAYHDGSDDVFFVETGHSEEVGSKLGLDRREIGAVSQAHHEQARRIGRREGREFEFGVALEIREGIVIAPPSDP